jgi:hypothetical protein
MNTGGKNYDETTGVVAHNAIHHSREFASKVVLTVVKRSTGASASTAQN